MRFILISLLAGSLLTSCGGKSGAPPPTERRVPDLPSYDKSSCAFQPYEGQAAAYANLGATQILAEPLFHKKFDRSDLDAVLSASATETSFYVRDMGVNLFKVPRAQGCPTYYSLPPVGEDLQTIWNKMAGGTGEGQLAGLYFENTNSPNGRQVVNPTIIVHESSDRWTLVHEMMHHNFNVQRKADPGVQSAQDAERELQNRAKAVDTLIKSYEGRPNKGDLMEIAVTTDRLTSLIEHILVNSIFEEIALENLLIDEKLSGRLSYVSDESLRSAAWYIGFARKEGMRQFEPLGELFRLILTEADKNYWDDVSAIAKGARSRIERIGKRTAAVEASARERVGLGGSDARPSEFLALLLLSSRVTDGHLRSLPGVDALEDFRAAMNATLGLETAGGAAGP